ncbi:hypothetical protein AKO1_006130 [Acrasis kona]|uniref:Protein kinase domain-containing protein n=1 Tax=Acrasis kona TaxID=1008807 RepID=A0AAW2YJ98_9EUKA
MLRDPLINSMDRINDAEMMCEDHIIPFNVLRFEQRINEGSYGIVFKGRYINAPVAIKRIKTDEIMTHEFMHEVKVLKSLRHPNIVLFMGVCVTKDSNFILTEFMAGGSLEDCIYLHERKSPSPIHECMPFKKKIRLLLEVVLGMTYLHSMNPPLCHRDLKPSNILLDLNHNTAKVCDFGTAKHLQHMSMTGTVGTLVYMSPEILISDRHYDESCDVYSFSICMYELFFEVRPYTNIDVTFFLSENESTSEYDFGNLFNLGFQVMNGARPAIPNVALNDAERDYVDLMVRCWDTKPKNRPRFDEIFACMEKIQNKIKE